MIEASAGRGWPPARYLPAVLFAGMVLAWGLNYLVVRVGLTTSAPLWLATYRAGLGALGVFAVLTLRPDRAVLDRRGRRDAMLLGIPNTGIFFGLWFVAAPFLLPGETSVLVYTFPLWVAILAGPVLGERLSRVGIVALAAGFAGVGLIGRFWDPAAGGKPLLPMIALLGGAVAWAVGTVGIQRRFPASAMLEVTAFQLVGGSLGLAAAALVVEGPPASSSPSLLLIVAVYLGLIGTAYAYGVWFWLLGRLAAGSLSRLVFLVPVVALVASSWLLNERLDALQLVGVALVLFAVYLTSRSRGSARPSPAPASPTAPG
ncbi:MAG: DMT family transporter [Thermoplasmata archaeon]|nr:DMT family transporter [Thermoplasmata archaeon]